MRNRLRKPALLVTGLLLFALPSLSYSLSIETVRVGNPGNPADNRHSDHLGSVGYVFQIGKYEITAGQYTAFLNAVGKSDPYALYNVYMGTPSGPNGLGCNIQRLGGAGMYSYSIAADWADRPVNYVSWGDAARFANWLSNGQPVQTLTGNPVLDAAVTENGSYYLNSAMTDAALMAVTRKPTATWVLPTADEWYKAAYHKNDGITGNYWEYPTATDSVPSNVLTSPDPGNSANFLAWGSDYLTLSSGCTIGSPYYRTPVGAFTNSKSPYGTYDQGGNVGELNETVVPIPSPPIRSWFGGSFAWYPDSLAAGFYGYHRPTQELFNLGFRVAYVPEPGGIALLAAAAASLLCYAWRRGRRPSPST